MKEIIFVTGATGNVGREIIANIDLGRFDVRAGVKDKINTVASTEKIEVVYFDFEDPTTFAPALQNVSKVFLMRPPQMGDPRKLYPFIDECKKSGIRQIVFLSLLGVRFNPLAPHGYIERHIRQAGIPYTFLRPSFFMQNLTTTHLKRIREDNEIAVPAGKGKTSFIDARDIGIFGAKIFTGEEFLNKSYDLTGSDALDYYQVAKILSDATGKDIHYTNPGLKKFSNIMRSEGVPSEFITVMKGIYLVAKFGLAGKVTKDFEKIIGRKPIAFSQFAEDYKNLII